MQEDGSKPTDTAKQKTPFGKEKQRSIKNERKSIKRNGTTG